MPELEPPALGQIERVEQSVEQRDVAEAQAKVLEPGAAHRIGREQNGLDIGAVAVGYAEAFDAGLAELARVGLIAGLRLEAEGGTVIAIAGFGLGVGVALEIKPRHRHGQVGAEAELIAGEVGEHIGAASDLLADLVEEDVGRLKDGRRNLLVARPPETIEQGRGLGFQRLEFFRQFSGHGSSFVTGDDATNGVDQGGPRAPRIALRPASSDIRRGPWSRSVWRRGSDP